MLLDLRVASEACTCPPSTDWGNGESYGHDILGDLQNWAVGWTDWNIVLNPQGGPNHVSNFCNAPIIADPVAQTLQYQPAYWYLGHFSRYLPPGSVRLQTQVTGAGAENVQVTTFVQPDVWNTQHCPLPGSLWLMAGVLCSVWCVGYNGDDSAEHNR